MLNEPHSQLASSTKPEALQRRLSARKIVFTVASAAIAVGVTIFAYLFAQVPGSVINRPTWTSWQWWVTRGETNPALRLPRLPNATLHGIVFADSSHGWAVGEQGLILHTDDGGTSWEVQPPPPVITRPTSNWLDAENVRDANAPQSQRAPTLFAAACTDALESWAVGESGTILHWANGKWTQQSVENVPSPAPSTPAAPPTNTRGIKNAPVPAAPMEQKPEGKPVDVPSAASPQPRDEKGPVRFASLGDAQRTGIVRLVENRTVVNVASPNPANFDLLDVAFADGQGWAVGAGGVILHTADGKIWKSQPSGTRSTLRALSILNSKTGWAVGDDRVILKMTDGVWASVGPQPNFGKAAPVADQSRQSKPFEQNAQYSQLGKSPPAVSAENTYRGVVFLNADTGCVVSDGAIQWTRNGKTFSEPIKVAGIAGGIESVAFINESQGWITIRNGGVRETTDGGKTWKLVESTDYLFQRSSLKLFTGVHSNGLVWLAGNNGRIYTTSANSKKYDPRSANAVAQPVSCSFVSQREGWLLLSDDLLAKTEDGGATWSDIRHVGADSAWPRRSLQFVDNDTGFGVPAGQGLVKTSDGGVTWQKLETSAPTFLELSFANSVLGWAVSYDHIYRTQDGGLSWIPSANGTGSDAAQSDHISFPRVGKGATGWKTSTVGGPDGQAAPILFSTADGGQVWQKKLNANGRPILINDPMPISLSFVDNQVGWYVGVGGSLHHTIDGGEKFETQGNGVAAPLSAVSACDPSGAWAIGDANTVLRTTDGGANWSDPRVYRVSPPPILWAGLACSALLLVPVFRRRELTTIEEKFIDDLLAAERPIRPGDSDPLEFGPLAVGLANYLRNADTAAPVTIAITGHWGSGKSSMMNLVREEMKAKGARPVWFNAWHHQDEEHLLASLLETILNSAAPSLWTKYGLRFRIKLIFRRFRYDWARIIVMTSIAIFLWTFFWNVGANLNAETVGVKGDFKPLFDAIGKGGGLLGAIATATLLFTSVIRPLTQTFGVDPAVLLTTNSRAPGLRNLRERTSFRYQFAQEFAILTESLKPHTLLVFIDDLDRCQPEAVMTWLEVINFLTTSGDCFFVLGMDYQRVEENVALARAAHLDKSGSVKTETPSVFAKNYMQKLVQVELPVPKMDTQEAGKIIETAAAKYQDVHRNGGQVAEPPKQPWRAKLLRDIGTAAQIPIGFVRQSGVVWSIAAILLVSAFFGGSWLAEAVQRKGDDKPKPQNELDLVAKGTVMGLPLNLKIETAHPDNNEQGLSKVNSTSDIASETPPAPASRSNPPKTPPADRPPINLTVAPGREHQMFWGWAVIVAGGLLVGVLISANLSDTAYRTFDSEEFNSAIKKWLPVLLKNRGTNQMDTPRSVKRFLNCVRLYAMMSRRSDGAESSRDPEGHLVALGALGYMEQSDLIDAALGGGEDVKVPKRFDEVKSELDGLQTYLKSHESRKKFFEFLANLQHRTAEATDGIPGGAA